MNAPCRPVFPCVIKVDVLRSQTAFYDLKTEDLHLRGKSYNAELVL